MLLKNEFFICQILWNIIKDRVFVKIYAVTYFILIFQDSVDWICAHMHAGTHTLRENKKRDAGPSVICNNCKHILLCTVLISALFAVTSDLWNFIPVNLKHVSYFLVSHMQLVEFCTCGSNQKW